MVRPDNRLRGIALGTLVALGGGCATEPTVSEQQFGSSVRQMIRAQLYDPAAAERPSPDPVTGLDGPQAEQALARHRQTVGRPEEVRSEIIVNIGP
jgi:hypothetical protein